MKRNLHHTRKTVRPSDTKPALSRRAKALAMIHALREIEAKLAAARTAEADLTDEIEVGMFD